MYSVRDCASPPVCIFDCIYEVFKPVQLDYFHIYESVFLWATRSLARSGLSQLTLSSRIWIAWWDAFHISCSDGRYYTPELQEVNRLCMDRYILPQPSWCMIMKHVIALASVSASTFTAYAKAQWSRSRTTSIWVGNCSMSEALSDEHVRSLCLGTAIAKRRLASVFDILRIRQEWAVRFHAPCAWLDSLVSSYDYSKSNLPLRTWFILKVSQSGSQIRQRLGYCLFRKN